jgi:hypothetical protein
MEISTSMNWESGLCSLRFNVRNRFIDMDIRVHTYVEAVKGLEWEVQSSTNTYLRFMFLTFFNAISILHIVGKNTIIWSCLSLFDLISVHKLLHGVFFLNLRLSLKDVSSNFD